MRSITRAWRPERILACVVLAAPVLLTMGVYWGQEGTTMPSQFSPTFQTVPAEKGPLVSSISTVGSVAAARQARLGFDAEGRLQELLVAAGERVVADQPLARLNSQSLQIRLAQAESGVRSSQLKLAQVKEGTTDEEIAAAKAAYEAALSKVKEVTAGPSKADLDAAQIAVDQSSGALAAAMARLSQLKAGPTNAEVASAEASVERAKAELASAEGKLAQVKSGPTQAEWASALATLDSSQAKLRSAQAKLDQVKSGPTLTDIANATRAVDQVLASLRGAEDRMEMAKGDSGATSVGAAQEAYAAARANYDAAVQKLNQVMSGPLATDLLIAQSAVESAQADCNASAARVDQMKKGPVPSDVKSAESAVGAAKAALVSAEAKLAQLKAGPTEADLLSAQSAVDSARSGLAEAQGKMADLGAGAKLSEVQSAQSSLASAKAQLSLKTHGPRAVELALAEEQVTLAQISLQQAKMDLENATIFAPFDGVVATVETAVGQQVRRSDTVITLMDPKALRVDVAVGESEVARISPGQQATVMVDALGGQELRSSVTTVAPIANKEQKSVTYLVSLDIDSPVRAMAAGMSARVNIETERKDDALLLPSNALRGQGPSRSVQVVVDGVPEERRVETGVSNEQFTEITSGLREGDPVVIRTLYAGAPR